MYPKTIFVNSNSLSLKKLLFIFCWFGAPALFAQSPNSPEEIDWLLDSVKTHYEQNNFDPTLSLAKEALQKSQNQGYDKGIRRSYYYLASSHFDKMRLNLSDSLFGILEQLAQQAGDTALWVKALNGQGNIAALQNDGHSALLLYYRAQKMAREKDPETYYAILSNMSLAYLKTGQYEEALQNLLTTAKYFEEQSDTGALAIVSNNIGELYREQLGNFPMARKHYHRAAGFNKAIGNRYQLSKNYNNLGLCFRESDNRDSALYYLQKSLKLKKTINEVGGLATCHYNLGNLYEKYGNFRKAVLHFDTTLAISRENGIEVGYFYAYSGLGKAYEGLGQNQKAEDYLLRSKDVAQKLGSLELEIQSNQFLYEFYKVQGNYEQALFWLELQKEKSDSVHKSLESKDFAQLRTLYEKELSDRENLLLKASQKESHSQLSVEKQTKAFYLLLAIALLLCAIILLVAFRQRQIRLRVQQETNRQLEVHLERLREQQAKLDEMNQMKNKIFSVLGHDLRSPLTSILGFIHILEFSQSENPELSDVVKHLKTDTEMTLKTLENILAWSRLQMNEKGSERSLLDIPAFMLEQQSLFQSSARLKKIELLFKYPENVQLYADEHQLRSMVSNLIANALKFSHSNSTVYVEVNDTDQHLEIRVSDEGVGMDQEVMEKLSLKDGRFSKKGTHGELGTGIGLRLVREFTAMNNGELEFKQREPKGTMAIIRFKKDSYSDRSQKEETLHQNQ